MTLAEVDKSARTARDIAHLLHAFVECDNDVQSMIHEMLKITYALDTTDQEKEAAELTIFEALFPKYSEADGQLGFSLDDDVNDLINKQLDEQEKRFVERVQNLMTQKGISQTELSKATGVNQSAIAMMLKRNCRPQRRTVKKLAEALGVDARMLWP